MRSYSIDNIEIIRAIKKSKDDRNKKAKHSKRNRIPEKWRELLKLALK